MDHGRDYVSSEIHSTDFAITTVNVPDRLDMRDMDDRKQWEDDYRVRWFNLAAFFRAWGPRLIAAGVVITIALLLFQSLDAWRNSLSANQLASRLTATLGVPVTVGDSRFAISPKPRLVLSEISINKLIVLDEVSLGVDPRQFGQALQGHGWTWGEALVTARPLSLEQCQGLISLLGRFDTAFPKSFSALHFQQLRIADQAWLSGSWDLTVSRQRDEHVSTATARLYRNSGFLRVDFTPTADPEVTAFQLEGHDWTLPFGPQIPLEEIVANGKVSPKTVEIPHFSIGSTWGVIKGALDLRQGELPDANWLLSGTAESEGVDLSSLIRQLAAGADSSATAESTTVPEPTTIQGLASFSGRLDGQGMTFTDAVSSAAFVAPVHVRFPVLSGINLGYAAARPNAAGVTSGGSTRFSNLDMLMTTAGENVRFREIHARAGALATSGEVAIIADHRLRGELRVDLGSTRILAPIRVMVRGDLLHPAFGR